jgi:hypothetical protein
MLAALSPPSPGRLVTARPRWMPFRRGETDPALVLLPVILAPVVIEPGVGP